MMTMSDAGDRPGRKDRDGNSNYAVAVVMGLFVVFGIVALPFMPLLVALCEETLFQTRHVEELCERVGIHDELGSLYRAVFGWFM
jgi:hypothetical protein